MAYTNLKSKAHTGLRNLGKLVKTPFLGLLAKRHWRSKRNPCENSEIIYGQVPEPRLIGATRILEFGCNWGGNLKYFMDRHPTMETVGIDINKIVQELGKEYSNYRGVVGDESVLSDFGDREFDFAFTASVLDHIPSERTVRAVIGHLLRISEHVLLLEPAIAGVEGDISGKQRAQVDKSLPDGYKVFAAHSYLWNYEAILNDLGADWTKTPCPLHRSSLGPFYHAYWATRAAR